jgi:hypothetical protein
MLGSDNYFSHDQGELAGQQFALTSLISNRYVRATDIVSCQSCNVVKNVVSNLHNQPGRIGYEEIHCDAHRRGA